MNEIRCHVCGWVLGYPSWGDDGHSPTYYICDCRGAEFGYHDFGVSGILSHRQKWINSGGTWFKPKEKPDGWSMEEQLRLVPNELPPGTMGI